MNYNRTIVAGRLTRDPEVKYSPKGTAIGRLGVAVNRSYKQDSGEQKEETTFVDVTLFGRTAEVAAQYLKKGATCLVEGRLKTEEWEDKSTKEKRSNMIVIGEVLQLGSKASGQSDRSAPKITPSNIPTAPAGPVDDVPF